MTELTTDQTLIDTESGTMYAIKAVNEDENTVVVTKTEQTTADHDDLVAGVEAGSLISPSELDEKISDMSDQYRKLLLLGMLSNMKDELGDDIDDEDAAQFFEEMQGDGTDDSLAFQ